MKKWHSLLFMASLMLLIAPISHAASLERGVIGKWKEVGRTATMEFFKDGTIILVDENVQQIAGNFKILDDTRLKMDLGGI